MNLIQENSIVQDEFLEAKKRLKKQQKALMFKRIMRNRGMVIGGITMIFLLLLAIVGPFLISYGPYEMIVTDRLQAPSAAHLLGTDNFGRDLLSRMAYGARVSLSVGLSVAALACFFGMIFGLLASYYRALDNILMRICDGLMAIPGVLLAIALVAALGPKKENVIIALTIVFIPNVARVVRSAALVVREETYIEAIRAQGAKTWRIIVLHIAPNTIAPLVVQASFIFADAIITEAALSFLGAGIPAPEPSWGNILHDGKVVIFSAWWMTVFPGILIVLSVLGLNLLGDGIRDYIDPHTRK
ncbi:ABC transporter permease [Sporosarcina sp. P33]|uniref:ABC transporter permease n=1 Tax=Sporosarcina sp. P33 TaxID=1930764 RepID=UPI0009C0B706|nr:ABC transporter permease [Sporosarcina sp. P33]ARD48270.1 peptide ABC transporter permease [Sporosarcina sp. P33]